MQSKIHLQGVGLHDAIPAGELQTGMCIVYNYGIASDVTSVTSTKSGKSVVVTTRSEDGKEYTRKYLAGTLVAVEIMQKNIKKR